MHVLVAAASRHGSTEEIARQIAERLRSHGLEVVVASPEAADLEGVDAVVIGSAVYTGKWLPTAREFVRAHMTELRLVPVWTFSSGPVGKPPKPVEESAEGLELAELVHARGHRTFVGRIEAAKLRLAERALAKLIGATNEDHRDWDAIDAFADEVATQLGLSVRA